MNPISHTETREDALQYGVEPYVMAGDIASVPPHTGRGGWTWYSGSAAWAWRLGVEAILGLRRVGDELEIDPRIPKTWKRCSATLRYPGGIFNIRIEDPQGHGCGASEIWLDDDLLTGRRVPLPKDGKEHEILVHLGEI